MKNKLDELTKNFQALIKNKDPKNGADVLESLISLQSKIISQKNLIDQKSSKIESKIINLTRNFLKLLINLAIFHKELVKIYDETRIRITELQKTLGQLKQNAISIKKDIQLKEKYFNACG